MKRFLLLVILVAAGYAGVTQHLSQGRGATTQTETGGDAAIAQARENRVSGVQVQGQGTVIKILPDDNDGSRHQRFILKLRSGHTLLVAHNIDLAPRIASLRIGDEVAFNGEYEWNAKGGVIHWTHHDPKGRHVPGWLKHGNQTYQ